MLSHNKHHNNLNPNTNTNNQYNSGTSNLNSNSTMNDPSYSSSGSSLPSSSMSHTFDADKDRTRMNMDRTTGPYATNTTGMGTGTGTETQQPYGSGTTGTQYGSTGTTGLGTGTQPYSSGPTGTDTYGSSGTTGLIGSKYPNEPQQSYGTNTHHARTGTQYAEPQQPYSGAGTQQPYTGTQQPYSGTQQPYDSSQQYGGTGTQQPYGGTGTQQPYRGTGTQQPYGATSGTGALGGKQHTVDSVTRDVQAQIDAQAEEAIRKSRELSAQDQARLHASIRDATASLEEQARQLKQQIDQERLAAEQNIKQAQQQKLHATAQQQQMEEQKILEAAAQRKLELEQRASRLQQEIDEIVRQKTQQMMAERPGNLCFTHQHQDTTVGAQLAGDIGHILDLKNSGRVSEATMMHNPNLQQQQAMGTTGGPSYPIQSQVNTVQGQETHEKKGFFHALKTAFTGHHDKDSINTQNTGTGPNNAGLTGTGAGTYPSQGNTTGGPYSSQVNTGGTYPSQNTNTGLKQQPMMGNRPYDSQSSWASNADKHAHISQPTQ